MSRLHTKQAVWCIPIQTTRNEGIIVYVLANIIGQFHQNPFIIFNVKEQLTSTHAYKHSHL